MKEIRAHGGEAEGFNTDLADRTAPKKLIDAVEKRFGGADILINNAGIIRRANFLEYLDEDWDAVMDVNIRAAFVLSREFAKKLAARKAPGRIINIASMLSLSGRRFVCPAYTACEKRHRRPHQGHGQRTRAARYLCQCHRPGLYGDGQHDGPARRCRTCNKSILERIPAGTLGRAHGPQWRGGVPRFRRCGLCARHHAAGGRRLAGAINFRKLLLLLPQ